MRLDFQSGAFFRGLFFDQLKTAMDLGDSYAVTVRECWFLSITHNVVKFRTNAHNFRMVNCNGTGLAEKGGAIIHFANQDGRETHSVLIQGNDFEKIGTIIRVDPKSGGLTGLTGIANYSEGFTPGRQFFAFPRSGVRSFEWTGGSFSIGRQKAEPERQVIDNVDGGRIDGIRLFGIDLVVESESVDVGRLWDAKRRKMEHA